MSSAQPSVIDPDLLVTIRRHLEGLRRSPDGAALYTLIERGLQRFAGADGRIELAFVTFLNSILGRYAKDEANPPPTRVKARLIQQRLMLHLPSPATSPPPAVDSEQKERSIEPASSPPGASQPVADDVRPVPESDLDATATASPEIAPIAMASVEDSGSEAGDPTYPAVDLPPVHLEAPENGSESTAGQTPSAVPPAQDAAGPEQPPRESTPTGAQVSALVDRVTESITFNQEFDALLNTQSRAIARVDNAIRDFNEVKQLIANGLQELMRERETLQHQLTSAAERVRAAEVERTQLRRELGKARKHSLHDELTGLPKTESFVRNLESEIGRVRRYGFALTLALVDIDGLEAINREHGREAGDAVLRCYASEILGSFRSYDVVARYDEDSFAVLFPNTQKEGAIRALNKARKRVKEAFLTHNDSHFPMPGFSSVLAVYAPGEKASALLRRADEALDHAKLKARGQTVLALPSS